MTAMRSILCLQLLVLATAGSAWAKNFETRDYEIDVSVVADGLAHPWGMAFLPDGDILITERGGALRVVRDGRLLERPIGGLPEIRQHGQGGLLDVTLHPDFAANRLVYLSYAGRDRQGYSTEVLRGRLEDGRLTGTEVIFRAEPKSGSKHHFGSRLLFAPDGHLFVSLGDRGDRPSAQDPGQHNGSLIRINDDGSIPEDNPFVGRDGVRPEIYTLGNRNMQGMALRPGTDEIWTHEHGPQGGDEVNLMRPGVNYGWPVITYGRNYGIGTAIGEGTSKPGMEQPVHTWVPSIAPSGMTFYDGEAFPRWRGDLLVGSLKFGQLVRLRLDGDRIVDEERMLDDAFGRIRDVEQGPDGLVYLLTDERRGSLLRVAPAE